jgi:hypothetical protein
MSIEVSEDDNAYMVKIKEIDRYVGVPNITITDAMFLFIFLLQPNMYTGPYMDYTLQVYPISPSTISKPPCEDQTRPELNKSQRNQFHGVLDSKTGRKCRSRGEGNHEIERKWDKTRRRRRGRR